MTQKTNPSNTQHKQDICKDIKYKLLAIKGSISLSKVIWWILKPILHSLCDLITLTDTTPVQVPQWLCASVQRHMTP